MTDNLIERAEAFLRSGTEHEMPDDIIRDLLAVVKRLPRTADGVPVMPGDWVWVGQTRFKPDAETMLVPVCVPDGKGGWRDLHVSECHSTRTAAEQARKGGA